MKNKFMRNDEQIIFALRELYESRGYSQYKMIKFEEYDLYVRNKDFLVSENIITFNDTNGKLMALKPDVTLSIIKNTKANHNRVNKVYYNENVYRASKSGGFKEIMQVGLECLGAIDDFLICESLILAAKSLMLISPNCVLNISDLEILSFAIDKTNCSPNTKKELLRLIGEKNLHELTALCEKETIAPENAEILSRFVAFHGTPDRVIKELKAILPECEEIAKLEQILECIDEKLLEIFEIDFSYVGDINYYNGIIFKGYISGVPEGVLSGGQYDKLMKKMGQNARAIGFAVYLDSLERLTDTPSEYDIDTVLVYDDTTSLKELNKKIEELTSQGITAYALREIPDKLRYREKINLSKGGGV